MRLSHAHHSASICCSVYNLVRAVSQRPQLINAPFRLQIRIVPEKQRVDLNDAEYQPKHNKNKPRSDCPHGGGLIASVQDCVEYL